LNIESILPSSSEAMGRDFVVSALGIRAVFCLVLSAHADVGSGDFYGHEMPPFERIILPPKAAPGGF